MKTVLLTGGAGYIGSHVAKLMVKAGYGVLIVDELIYGVPNKVYGKLYKGNFGDEILLRKIFSENKVDAVMHFAAYIVVPESVENPLKYYENNVKNTITLLKVMKEFGIRKFLFSSSAAVYGIPDEVPVKEDAPLKPINPYGRTKAMIEEILKDLSQAKELDYVSLRYFNVAGVDPEGEIGYYYSNPTHLIIRALKVAKGELPEIEIYGTDYPTPDGTCIRDYIHVMDLAQAHILAVEYLFENEISAIFNCGYGKGFSVKQVVEAVKEVTGKDFKVKLAPRRKGDPPILVADNQKIKKVLKWAPKYDSLKRIIQDAWNWEKKTLKFFLKY